ncbi:uncharacterized protein F5891DRAFT_228083 [Suillus fuscotomentosus]|uniref:Uncharacterized protein n=1 Tax=Suillus fuscotomentosus TaxID=1912939 RepID=A0AAD4HL51_9AGAM|nr:uncharacterized protein F5891DRAFT_595490 [Suillus fuscotomentosus]XP_041227270.1 uncharacterized protein F5891DRAFT_228083 [Suillus fuscotomentosus]KAG1896498.1 hypothetical protein F5891DRAFT_595490 [Suillus fuscotomentosus]KAG1901695.1 hypothetical protein F5891DRAFT_228083 [Suillus fuscotomentosus]
MPPLLGPIADSQKFSLDASGVAGFFGGEEAITAMATVHLYRGRRWLGWYNSPGSYTIAKEFGRISKSRFWSGLFPGSNHDPAIAFKLDVKTGPKYVASRSGTVMQQTGHFAHLLTQGTDDATPLPLPATRTTTNSRISIVTVPEIAYHNLLVQTMSYHHAVFASFPILVSISTCIFSALFADWYCFAMILLGIISSGVTCFIIGSGVLDIETVKNPAEGSPPGDGILLMQNGVIILKGKEKDVNAITKGKFSLKLKGAPEYTAIGLCSLLLEVQFLLQLLLIPQGLLIGQIMFLTSVVASWAYNSFLASLDNEKLQRKLFCETIKLHNSAIVGFNAGTRTSMAAFTCFVLCENLPRPLKDIEPMKILLEFLPNETPVWQKWREQVVAQVEKEEDDTSIFQPGNVNLSGLNSNEQTLLATLLQDAKDAYDGYIQTRGLRQSLTKTQ